MWEAEGCALRGRDTLLPGLSSQEVKCWGHSANRQGQGALGLPLANPPLPGNHLEGASGLPGLCFSISACIRAAPQGPDKEPSRELDMHGDSHSLVLIYKHALTHAAHP